MKQFSTNNTYGLTNGTRLSRSQIESRIRQSKKQLIDNQLL